jgi:hypothetical protein
MSGHYFYANCRRKIRERPVATGLGGLAVTSLVLSATLAANGLTLLAELIGGLALVPISLAIWLCLLPATGWFDDGHDGRGGSPPNGPSPAPAGGPDGAIDWAAFERQFWAHVEQENPAYQPALRATGARPRTGRTR